MEYLFIIWVVFGVIGCSMAMDRGRSAIMGFLAGFIFTIWAVFYYLIVGDTLELRIKKTRAIEAELDRNKVPVVHMYDKNYGKITKK